MYKKKINIHFTSSNLNNYQSTTTFMTHVSTLMAIMCNNCNMCNNYTNVLFFNSSIFAYIYY